MPLRNPRCSSSIAGMLKNPSVARPNRACIAVGESLASSRSSRRFLNSYHEVPAAARGPVRQTAEAPMLPRYLALYLPYLKLLENPHRTEAARIAAAARHRAFRDVPSRNVIENKAAASQSHAAYAGRPHARRHSHSLRGRHEENRRSKPECH